MENITPEKESDDSMKNETLQARWSLGVGLVLMIFLPIILSQLSWKISFMDTGQIGDTIGGITAPISGLLGAYLVFLALKAQVKANRIQVNMLQEQRNEIKRRDVLDHIERTESNIIEMWKELAKTIDRVDSKSTQFNIWMSNNVVQIKKAIVATQFFTKFLASELENRADDLIFKQMLIGFYVNFQSEPAEIISKVLTNMRWEHTIADSEQLRELLEDVYTNLDFIRRQVMSISF